MINELLAHGEPFIICFKIKLESGEELMLSSSNAEVNIGNAAYYPYSGLKLESFESNDSAHNYVKITGVFEKGGIEQGLKLDGSEIEICFYFEESKGLTEYITYPYDKIEHDGIRFTITLKSKIFNLRKSILKHYGSSCRAAFGDKECKINKRLYAKAYKIISSENDIIKIADLHEPDGFYTGGNALFNGRDTCKIISHTNSSIIVKEKIKAHNEVVLMPGCDKKFITCCNKYNNAVNFRGEPFIP